MRKATRAYRPLRDEVSNGLAGTHSFKGHPEQGTTLYEVMHLTGHKSFEMVQRYGRLAPDFQERAIGALNTYGTVSAQSA